MTLGINEGGKSIFLMSKYFDPFVMNQIYKRDVKFVVNT